MSVDSPDFRDRNRRAWNHFAASGSLFARVATDDEVAHPLKTLDGRGWLPSSVNGKDVLCLASGGGWQAILYAAAGARVTVVDISDEMLQLDIRESRRRGLNVRTLAASMDDLSDLGDATFDIVHQPVSTCYVPDLSAVYRETARVLRDQGIYISQHKQPTSLQVSHRNDRHHFVIGVEYYQDGPVPPQVDESYRESGAVEYLHRWEELVGGLCRAGFILEDLTEPCRADRSADVTHYGYRGRYIAPYVRMKARRRSRSGQDTTNAENRLWIPDQTASERG
ncbi:MAG: class I SAM-dependent methyltransferase [Fuerstiella sp.]|nr:class I SAM-dependent methyltransferase [Fuerstiella sp.]